MQQLTENLWVMRFPLALMGTQIGRTVSIIRLQSGEVVIHSTAPFRAENVDAVCKLGRPKWLLDATLFHDTFARVGRSMFPSSAYLAPEGFAVHCQSLSAAPPEWEGELDVLELKGMPSVREHVFFHRASRTLILADLVFNFDTKATAWTRFFFRWGAGIRRYPGVSRMFRLSIRNRKAFTATVRQMMQWDFEHVVVGHGQVIEADAKPKLTAALADFIGN